MTSYPFRNPPLGTKFTILLISDLHSSLEMVDLLGNEIVSKGINVDMTCFLGDAVDYDNERGIDSMQELARSSGDYLSAMFSIGSLNPLPSLTSRFLHVPGNHDPFIFFTEKYKKSSIGGSCPAVVAQDLTDTEKVYWKGFPFDRTDSLVSTIPTLGSPPDYTADDYEDVVSLWRRIGRQMSIPSISIPRSNLISMPPPKDVEVPQHDDETFRRLLNKEKDEQIVLLLHCGPRGSRTCEDWRLGDKAIETGSTAITEAIKENDIFFAVHGHCHRGLGQGSIGSCPIINPGPLKTGNYSIIELKLGDDGWNIDMVEHIKLP